ncbi:hypothetical protein CMQ_6745 [Grosmannia clavigera kw1407]|uniref:Uncharacterized protein n=1 Tax=Grosmannia clavigera (strain kw1407 / UAMH 11150) TaxID=655863 RepID=F0X739_GROCL|nr:uncharacterized protein CMQ_6745 [Grosmannia clavigera kw1407]EFX06424.1 hypothetical protein CMQ_6745 [Grosmannia clavigera kw1407]
MTPEEMSILGELDAADLENKGLLGPGTTTGSRRIHKRLLNSSGEDEYHDISLQINLESPDATNAFATIPVSLISHDSLVYLGFSAAKSDEIWSQWTDWPSEGPSREIDPDNGGLQVTFIDFVRCRLRNYEDTYEDNDDQWCQCLSLCGMSKAVQDAIMDPQFKRIRLTNSCIFWIRDTIVMRYAGLEDIQRASRQREIDLIRVRDCQDGSGSGRGAQSRNGRDGSPQPDDHQQATPWVPHVLWNSATMMEVRNNYGHIVLFKDVVHAQVAGLFDDSGKVQRIEKLLSHSPSDFSAARSLFYFTPDHREAEYRCAYAKRRANCESVVMVCLTIPQTAIDKLRRPKLQRLYWPSPEWKQVVWRSKTVRSLPSALRKYRDALLIIGSVANGTQRKFENMKSWADVADDAVCCDVSSGDPTVQYVFSSEEEGCKFLKKYGKLEVFPFAAAELQKFLKRNP